MELDKSSSKNHNKQWVCQCECGNIVTISSPCLVTGKTKSCGCLQKEIVTQSHKKYNTYDLTGEYGIGYTEEGREFYFDLEDYDKIKDYYWSINNLGYVECHIERLLMHRLIFDLDNNIDVDHIFHRNNDNRKSQLRICTHQKNMCNTKLHKNNHSGVSGICWANDRQQWRASITYKKHKYNLGSFNNLDDAIKIRLQAEKQYFKEFAPQKHLFKKYGIEDD